MDAFLSGPPLAAYGERTLNTLFLSAVRRFADLPALGDAASGARLTFAEVEARVAGVARLLRERGVEAGDRVAILSENRPEWAIVDYAVLSLAAVTVPIYPSLPAGQVAAILADSAPKVVFVSDAVQARKLGDATTHPPAGILSFDPVDEPAWAAVDERATAAVGERPTAVADDAGRPAEPIVALSELLPPLAGEDAANARVRLDAWRERAAAVTPDELATLIYTSGTTGTPKGVMLTHGNLAAMVAATRQHGSLDVMPGEVVLSILPLSHVFERAADYYFFGYGVTIVYAESMQTVPRDLLAVRPHHLIAVPRLFEKVHAAAVGAPGLKGRIARWAADTAVEWVRATSGGARASVGLRARHAVADRVVYAKLRARLGGRLRTFISGGAPLEPRVGALFLAAAVPVYEGYGLTETSPVIAANRPGAVRLGSAGVPYPGVEVRLGAQDEIQVRGPGVTRGYWRRPDATAAAFTGDGWFRTGDVGAVEDGVLLVVDRLKELIVTAGGKNVAPQPLEARVVASPLISQAVLVGDRRPYLVMLVVPEMDALDDALRESPDAGSLGWLREVEKRIAAEVATRLHGAGRVEQPKRIAVLREQFTVDNELLTPTLKVRRRAVERAYAALLDRLYAGSTGVSVPWREG